MKRQENQIIIYEIINLFEWSKKGGLKTLSDLRVLQK